MKFFICALLISCASGPALMQRQIGPWGLHACDSVFVVTPGLDQDQIDAVILASNYWNKLLKSYHFIDGGNVDSHPTEDITRLKFGPINRTTSGHETCGILHWDWRPPGCIVNNEITISETCEQHMNIAGRQSVIRHELGHALGLDHSDDPLSVMYWKLPDWLEEPRGLTESEIEEFQALYEVTP